MDRREAELAELAVVGMLVQFPIEACPIVMATGLQTADFKEYAAAIVFDCVTGMYRDQEPITPISVYEKLNQRSMLEKAGGLAFLEKCVDQAVTHGHAEYYIDIVQEASRFRSIEKALEDGREAVVRGDAHSSVVAAGVSTDLNKIAEGALRERARSNGDLMWDFVRQCRAAWDGTGEAVVGLPMLWPRMTEMTCGLERGVTILAARPSTGKTMFEDQLANELAGQGVGVLRFCLDMAREDLLQRCISRFAGQSLPKLKWGYAGEKGLALAEDAVRIAEKLPIWIEPDRDITQIERKCRIMKLKHPEIGLITVDFLQKVECSIMGNAQTNRNLALGWIMTRLKAMSLQLDVPVLALSQLRRLAPNERDKPPVLEDLRDSGEIEQDASKVWMLWLDKEQNKHWEEENEMRTPATRHNYQACWFKQAKSQNGRRGSMRMLQFPNYFLIRPCDEYWAESDAEGQATEHAQKVHGRVVPSGGELEPADDLPDGADVDAKNADGGHIDELFPKR